MGGSLNGRHAAWQESAQWNASGSMTWPTHKPQELQRGNVHREGRVSITVLNQCPNGVSEPWPVMSRGWETTSEAFPVFVV